MPSNSTKILLLITLVGGVLVTLSSNSWLGTWIGLEMNLISFTRSSSQDHHTSKNSVQEPICCNSTSNAPDVVRMYPKHVELRIHQIKLPSCFKLTFHFISRGRCTVKQPSSYYLLSKYSTLCCYLDTLSLNKTWNWTQFIPTYNYCPQIKK